MNNEPTGLLMDHFQLCGCLSKPMCTVPKTLNKGWMILLFFSSVS